jgi:hypothetical protein
MKDDSRFGDDAGAMEEWEAFLADNRHLRYEDTPANWDHLFGFLKEHELYFTRESVHLAYTTLGDTLELVPIATPIVIEHPPAPVPTQPPASVPRASLGRAPVAWRNGKIIELTSPQKIG